MAMLKTKILRKKVASLLPKRGVKANKTHGGRALIIAGQKGMFGAAVLAATAAERVGAGYVILMTDLKHFNSVKNPDFLTASLTQKISKINFSAVGIGPGLGQKPIVKKKILELKKIKTAKVVADADALNVIARHKLYPLPKTWVITPHAGELSRLLGVSAKKIDQNREKYLLQACKKLKCVVLLKGHKTLIGDGKKIFEIQTGNKALAKAGTGDVLTGMIAGFLAQGLTCVNAAILGATIHGELADQWVKRGNDYLSLMASDLNASVPKIVSRLRC